MICPLLVLIGTVVSSVLPSAQFPDDPPRSIYALLVAGSNGFNNYRHQADVAHAYHVLIQHGVPADNIVTMMYDDVAFDPKNPMPGELHNSPDGPDYRKGMTVDYRTTSVNKVVFQAVLTGDAVIAGAYPGSGRVLQSTKEDNVFVYYTDHGAYNLLGMPSGSPMTRSELAAYIQRARSAGKFHKLSVYIEACESGSMLAGFENDEFVNGLTASNASEDSYACNCAKGICYADLFSYKWMINSEEHNLLDLSISQQYAEVKSQVKSSTVQMFGSTSITADPVGYFQGTAFVSALARKEEKLDSSVQPLSVINIRDVPLLSLEMRVAQVKGTAEEAEIRVQLNQMLRKREGFSRLFEELMATLRRSEAQENGSVEQETCYESVVLRFDQHCFPLRNNPFAFGFLKRFYALCLTVTMELLPAVIDELQRFCATNALVKQLQDVE